MGRSGSGLGSDPKGDPARLLSQAWDQLRLTERAPLTHPSWDAILVTAASNAQAALFQQQLEAARYFGRIAKKTIILAVPDPQGRRIGSGGATLSALRVLADQLSQKARGISHDVITPSDTSASTGTDTGRAGSQEGGRKRAIVDPRLEGALEVLAGFRVLLVHGGGDSKRVPWANPIGKPFIPLPFLVANDSDEPIPTLFDHILAVAAPALGAMRGGGVLIMTGDVLPIFDSGSLFTPEDGACIVTTLASLDVASRHGVLVSEGGSKTPQTEGGSGEVKRAPSRENLADNGPKRTNKAEAGSDSSNMPTSVKPLNLKALPPIASIAKPTTIAVAPLFSPPISPHAERSSSPRFFAPGTASPPPSSGNEQASPRTYPAYRISSRSPPPLPTVLEIPIVSHLEEVAERATQSSSPRGDRSPRTPSKPPLYPPPQMVQPLSVSSLLSLQQTKPYYSSESHSSGGDLSPPKAHPPEQTPTTTNEPLTRVETRGLVVNLLQKPNAQEMEDAAALIGGGAALLDTGIFTVKGRAWRDLLTLAAVRPNPVEALLTSGEEMSLYEEVAGAWVPARHFWLQSRPLGPLLTDYLGGGRLWYHFAPELEFLHFGTTSEVLGHLASGWPIANRQLSSVKGDVGLDTVVIGSTVDETASIGYGGLISDSKLGASTTVGSRCVLLGVDMSAASEPLIIPDHQCVWVVPLLGGNQVTVCCGVDDNPKEGHLETGPSRATFCGVPIGVWLRERGLSAADLWPVSQIGANREPGPGSQVNKELQGTDSDPAVPGSDRQPADRSTRTDSKVENQERQPLTLERNLWNASLFPVEPRGAVLEWVPWLTGRGQPGEVGARWKAARRLSLAQIHRRIDFAALDRTVRIGRGELALAVLRRDVDGLLRRNVAALSEQILWGFSSQAETPSGDFADVSSSDWAPQLAAKLEARVSEPTHAVSESRIHMARADLLRAGGHVAPADRAEENAWRAVAAETAVGVGIASDSHVESSVGNVKGGVNGNSRYQRLGVREQGLALQEATVTSLAQADDAGNQRPGVNAPSSVNPPVGVNVSVGVNAPVVVNAPAGVNAPPGVHVPSGVNGTVGEDASPGVNAPAGASVPSGVNAPTAPNPPSTSELSVGVNAHPSVGEVYRVELPVRLDIAGGWSDTPPWSLERVGRVLNLAANLGGRPPVGVEIEVTAGLGVWIRDDEGRECSVPDVRDVDAPLAIDDPFAVAKAALFVTGFGSGEVLGPDRGLRISTWADVPRGSGLGTSSILAAALVRALLRLRGAPDSNEEVSHKVLVLEQLMGTGGGWQDQVGALWPGAKCTTSLPSRPLRLAVEEVPLLPRLRQELEERLVLVFTGRVRLARNVLQKVVGRYLRRDAAAIASVRRLTEIATAGQTALATGDLDALGAVLLETWGLHRELDPHCSNLEVEGLFGLVNHLSIGHKLLGAGGGGFALILARDSLAAAQMKTVLDEIGEPVKVYSWSLG